MSTASDPRRLIPALLSGYSPQRLLLQAEGAAVFCAALLFYRHLGGGWGLFALLFLLPDLVMFGYLAGTRWGAACYNAAHSYLAPLVLFGLGWLLALPLAQLLSMIWMAHIGLDRAVGYGLKYGTSFHHSHLSRA